jgi:hypothetical protein
MSDPNPFGKFTPKEALQVAQIAAQFEAWKEQEGYKLLRDYVSLKSHLCAEAALADGRIEHWRGVREGLQYWEEVIEGVLIDDANNKQLESLADDDGVDDLMPVPGMHGGEQ